MSSKHKPRPQLLGAGAVRLAPHAALAMRWMQPCRCEMSWPYVAGLFDASGRIVRINELTLLELIPAKHGIFCNCLQLPVRSLHSPALQHCFFEAMAFRTQRSGSFLESLQRFLDAGSGVVVRHFHRVSRLVVRDSSSRQALRMLLKAGLTLGAKARGRVCPSVRYSLCSMSP